MRQLYLLQVNDRVDRDADLAAVPLEVRRASCRRSQISYAVVRSCRQTLPVSYPLVPVTGARARWWHATLLVLVFAATPVTLPQASMEPDAEARARLLWEAGYIRHVMGLHEQAIESFRASIALHPTAEAHTFLGWTLSHLGNLREAIIQCEIAIRLDPDFGNPYNDTGVYLMELGRSQEAIPWFEKAIASKRYCCYQFAHANLGRVLLARGSIEEAKRSFERALEHDPDYLPALIGLELIRQQKLEGL